MWSKSETLEDNNVASRVNSQYLHGQENAWHWENLLKEVANDIMYDDDYDGDYDY